MNPQQRVEALYKEVCRQADEMVAYRAEIIRLGGDWQKIAVEAAQKNLRASNGGGQSAKVRAAA